MSETTENLRYSQSDLDMLHTIASKSSELLGGGPLTGQQFALCMDSYGKLSRKYHDYEHVKTMAFMTSKEQEAFGRALGDETVARKLSNVITLGGLYHDTVYTQVDGGVTPAIASILEKYTTLKDGVYTLRNDVAPKDKQAFDIVSTVFGVKAGDELPKPSQKPLQNELLSALVAVDQLSESGLAPKHLLQIAATIEGTVPFRDQHHFEELAARVEQANNALGTGMTQKEIEDGVKAAVFVANKDVLGFAGGMKETPKERFLQFAQGTWQLMPESNVAYDGTREYTPADYRKTMQGNHFFINDVLTQPDKQIFHQYKGYPSDEEFAKMRSNEEEVRSTMATYLKAKTVSAALVEAITAAVEPKASLVHMVAGNEAYLPKGDSEAVRNAIQAMSPRTQVVQDILRYGRGDTPGFDISSSPLAAYILPEIGENGIKHLFDSVGKNFKAGSENPSAYLAEVQAEMGVSFNPILRGLALVARNAGNEDRAAKIEALRVHSHAESLGERGAGRAL